MRYDISKATAPAMPNKLASAFASHHTCIVICRLSEATRADSREQHVQTPEAAKKLRMRIKKLKDGLRSI